MTALLPDFLNVSASGAFRHHWRAGQVYPSTAADNYILWLVLEGEIEVQSGDRDWRLTPGTAALWAPFEKRHVTALRETRWLSIGLRATLFGHIDLFSLLWPPILWRPEAEDEARLRHAMEVLIAEWAGPTQITEIDPQTMSAFLAQRYAAWPERDTAAAVLCDAYARVLVGLCWRMLGKIDLESAAGQNFPDWLSTALTRLRAEPDISIDRLAHETGISPAQLRRQFGKWFGTSPREYLNRQRLEDARQLLENSDLAVHDIAARIGFQSPAHFNRLFKSVYGVPPAQYRQTARRQAVAGAAV
jgi:AraC-like DNA-binding protein